MWNLTPDTFIVSRVYFFFLRISSLLVGKFQMCIYWFHFPDREPIPYSKIKSSLSHKISAYSFKKFDLQPKMSLNLASINYEMFVVFLMRGYETQTRLFKDFKLYWNDLISLFTSSLTRGVRKISCQSLILIRTLFTVQLQILKVNSLGQKLNSL